MLIDEKIKWFHIEASFSMKPRSFQTIRAKKMIYKAVFLRFFMIMRQFLLLMLFQILNFSLRDENLIFLWRFHY